MADPAFIGATYRKQEDRVGQSMHTAHLYIPMGVDASDLPPEVTETNYNIFKLCFRIIFSYNDIISRALFMLVMATDGLTNLLACM